MIYYHEFYFSNVPRHIDGGYCCICLTMSPQAQARYCAPESGAWNQHRVWAGRKAYSAILKWARFLGAEPTVYMNGEVSNYTHKMDYSRFATLLDLCQREIGVPADCPADSPADSCFKAAVARSRKIFCDAEAQ